MGSDNEKLVWLNFVYNAYISFILLETLCGNRNSKMLNKPMLFVFFKIEQNRFFL